MKSKVDIIIFGGQSNMQGQTDALIHTSTDEYYNIMLTEVCTDLSRDSRYIQLKLKILIVKKGGILNRPNLCGQYKKGVYGSKY